MKVETLWVVRDPTPESILEDICFKADTPKYLAMVILGAGTACLDENLTLYTEEAEARKDAKNRLETVRS